MANEKLDRYATLGQVRTHNLIRGNYIITEIDETKGIRISLVNKDKGVLKEIKGPIKQDAVLMLALA